MIFREIRQKKQELSRQEIADILHKGTSGVLALLGDNDYPYAVPISYVYDDGKIYFHGAKNGHKIDAIQRTAKASFCVIDKDLVVPEEYTTYFRSVIAFGKIRVIEDDREKRARYCRKPRSCHKQWVEASLCVGNDNRPHNRKRGDRTCKRKGKIK